MLVVTGVYEIAPEDLEKARAAAARVASITRTEAGCITYAFYEDIEQPGRFRIYEEWQDQAALSAHLETDHVAAFRTQMASFTILSRSLKKLVNCSEEPL